MTRQRVMKRKSVLVLAAAAACAIIGAGAASAALAADGAQPEPTKTTSAVTEEQAPDAAVQAEEEGALAADDAGEATAPAKRSPLSVFLDKDDWRVSDALWSEEKGAADDERIQQLLVECLVGKGYDRAAVEAERKDGVWNGTQDAATYYADMEGTDEAKSQNSDYDPANFGCFGEAAEEVRGDVVRQSEALRVRFGGLEEKLNKLAQGMTGFELPQEMASLNADFSACVSDAGFGEYPTPYQLEFAIMNDYVAYDEAAADGAIADCKTSTDYDARALAAQVEMENSFIAANEPELTEYKAAHDELLSSIGMK